MEEQLKSFPLLTLTETALRRTAVLLWSHPDVLASVSSLKIQPSSTTKDGWQSIEDQVQAKVSKLQLPESFLKRLSNIVTPVGLEIREWKRKHECGDRIKIEESDLPGSTKLCWTSAGRVNYRETAKELFSNESDAVLNYTIACEYCLEDSVAFFWEQLPEDKKEYFGSEDNMSLDLRFQWPHMLKGEQSKLDEWSLNHSPLIFNRYAFERAARTGDRIAAEYFLKKLTQDEIEAAVKESIPLVIQSLDTERANSNPAYKGFYYLLTLMTPEQQMETLKTHPVHVFLSFFDLNWPDPFSENADLLWKHLPPSDYAHLLIKLGKRYESTTHYFPQLFGELFFQSPPDFKRCFVDKEYESGLTPACRYLYVFSSHEHAGVIEAVFRHLDAADRVKVVFHNSVLLLFLRSILRYQWPMVKVCLRAAELSEEERKRLRSELAGLLGRGPPATVCWVNNTLKRFFDFLDETDSSAAGEDSKGQKRKLEVCPPE